MIAAGVPHDGCPACGVWIDGSLRPDALLVVATCLGCGAELVCVDLTLNVTTLGGKSLRANKASRMHAGEG